MNPRYEETTEWLFTQLPMFQRVGASAYKPGLDTARGLASMFGNPHRKLRTIHVAGTNGKGSTSSTIAAILTAAGMKTGLYTSPHLVDFRERIRINGRMITEDAVVEFVDRYRSMTMDSPSFHPSFFELATIMAFDYFAREGVDVAVIEVGLGGRLDTTNIITPDLSVITNISLDHTALLGTTRREIAAEKAGIIKPGIPVVIGEADEEVRPVFEEVARRVGAPVVFAEDEKPILKAEEQNDGITYETKYYRRFKGELRGECQVLNAATILTAIKCLEDAGYPNITGDAVARGFAGVGHLSGLTGRWTQVCDNPVVIADTGHNIGGWEHTVNDLNRIPTLKTLVLGFVNDKDVSAILQCISRVRNAEVIFTNASVDRALPAAELQARAAGLGVTGRCISGVSEAAATAIDEARRSGATVFVGGSNFVVGDFLAHFNSELQQ